MSPSRSTAQRAVDVHDGIARCHHTLLTKPECHCRACLFEQIATHGGRPDLAGLGRPQDVERAAA
jgi:hypothetical protein